MSWIRIWYPLGSIDRLSVELDLGNHEAVLLGELLADLGHAVRQFVARAQQMDREVPAERQLDLRGLERFLDGFLGIDLGTLVGLARIFLLLQGCLPPGQRVSYEGHDAAEQQERRRRQPRHQGEHEHH
ncbi:hypothetical protein ACVWWO_006766 [Bradyrhizobium sp. F1.13.1]